MLAYRDDVDARSHLQGAVAIGDKVLDRPTMGGGDIKLFFAAGLYFGWQQGLFLIIVACIIGILVSLLTIDSKDVKIEFAVCAVLFYFLNLGVETYVVTQRSSALPQRIVTSKLMRLLSLHQGDDLRKRESTAP